jgi:methionyl-tRNA formyltransferase
VLIIGLGATSRSALDGLAGDFDIVALLRDTDDDTVDVAAQLGVPVVRDTTVVGVEAAIRDTAPDAVVVSSFNRILGRAILEQSAFVNVHYAPLPRGRGRATVNWAIINGDDRATITIHHLVPELDAGGILYQGSVPITGRSTVTSLYDELNELQRLHIAGATRAAIAGEPGTLQDCDSATYYCTRVPDDGEIDWTARTIDIDRLVRALQPPYPSAFTWWGLERLHVDVAEPVVGGRSFEGRVPGRVVDVDRHGGGVVVLTGDGALKLDRVRLGTGDQVDAASVIRSVTATVGLRTTELVDQLRRAHEWISRHQ